MVWTCTAQHRLNCRSTQAECGCTEKIWQAKEIMGWSAWEWQKEARYGFCWPSESFWVDRTPSRKTCQKAQPSVEENRALKWIWWWWYNTVFDITQISVGLQVGIWDSFSFITYIFYFQYNTVWIANMDTMNQDTTNLQNDICIQ